MIDAVVLSNLGAGVVVGKVGTATVSPAELAVAMEEHLPIRRGAVSEDELVAMVARARRQGSRIILVLPPVSPAGVALMGAGQQRELATSAQGLARRLGVPLFSPDGPWSNSEFIDQGHVNSAGRHHFLSSLRRWWRAQA